MQVLRSGLALLLVSALCSRKRLRTSKQTASLLVALNVLQSSPSYAGNGGGDAGAETVKFLIAGGFCGIGGRLIDDFGEGALELGALEANRGGFYRKCLRAKGFHFKAVVFKLLGDAGEDDHLFGLQFHKQRHKQALALDAFHLAVAEDLLKKHSFVCNVLVDDPQSIVSGGQNE